MNESVLIAKAEKFLDGIRHNWVKADEINDFGSFINIYQYLKNNLEELQELRDTMEIKGYKTPYRSLMKYGRTTKSEMKVDDIYDVNKHTQYFRMNAAAKKNILDRVKSAIASHKIAIGHLEEFATLSCSKCSGKFTGHELSTFLDGNCTCGSSEIELEVNHQGVYRLEIIKYLPLSGEYMVKMSELSPMGREAFRKIVRILKHEKRGIVKTLSLVIKVFEDGRWVRKRVNIDAKDQMNYEREIRREYGSNARIEFMQFHRKKPSIINDKHVQTALSIGYVKLAEQMAREVFLNILDKIILNKEELHSYDEVQKKAKDLAKKMVEDPADMDHIKEELIQDMLLKEGLRNSKGKLNTNLKANLESRVKLKRELFVEVPRVMILWDILKCYLSTSYDRRSKYSGPFPNLRPNLDTNQIKAFEDFDEGVVKILKDFMHENIEYMPDIKNLLSKKFEMENKMKGLHVKTNSNAAGAVLLNTTGNIPVEVAARVFSVDPEDVKVERNKFETFGKPQTKKAKKFLEMIKG
jgi:Zn-finger domain-containing protein